MAVLLQKVFFSTISNSYSSFNI